MHSIIIIYITAQNAQEHNIQNMFKMHYMF